MSVPLAPQSKGQKKPFIVDVPAKMLQRHVELTKGARVLYLALRSIANGKTGEIAIRGNPLDWHYICKKAEISRCTWLKYRKELIAAGFLLCKRDRVSIYRKGRKLSVLGRARYFVTRQPNQAKTAKKPLFLLKSNSCTVQELDPQISSETPSTVRGVDSSVLPLSRKDTEERQSSSPKIDDDAQLSVREKKEEKEQLSFYGFTLDAFFVAVRKRIRSEYCDFFDYYRSDLENDDFMRAACELVDSRMKPDTVLGSPIAYFAEAVANILDSEDDLEEVRMEVGG